MRKGSAGIVIGLDSVEQARLVVWETAVKERLQDASRFGVPNWIVAKHCKSEPGTDKFYREFTSQAERLRGEYGLRPVGAGAREEYLTAGYVPTGADYERLLSLQNGGNPPKGQVVPTNVPTSEVVPTCVACGKNPPEARYNICAACRKRAWRQRKA